MVYFTSGTSSRPKLVEHTHVSYPVGHLSSLYFNGLMPGDVHLNLSDPGWAKHSWSSLFVPWTAEATIIAAEGPAGSGAVESRRILDLIAGAGVTSVCAPPRVWRALIQAGLGARLVSVREATSAGEQLDPGVVATVEEAWGVTIRDGYGQTETTAQIGNTPGQSTRPGAVGRPLPGYRIVLVDPATGQVVDEGEICVQVAADFPALMRGYDDDPSRTTAGHGGRYRTGDLGRRDDDGYITVLGRVDDVFQFDGHRVSPAEIESVLVTHPAVTDAAVVGVADSAGDRVAKAFVVPADGAPPSLVTAAAIFGYSHVRLAAHARVRRVAFVAELPKTASGKVRRAALRDSAAVLIESESLTTWRPIEEMTGRPKEPVT